MVRNPTILLANNDALKVKFEEALMKVTETDKEVERQAKEIAGHYLWNLLGTTEGTRTETRGLRIVQRPRTGYYKQKKVPKK